MSARDSGLTVTTSMSSAGIIQGSPARCVCMYSCISFSRPDGSLSSSELESTLMITLGIHFEDIKAFVVAAA